VTYEQRIALAKAWMKEEISPRFALPKGMNSTILIEDILEAVNSRLPNGLDPTAYRAALTRVRKVVVEKARGRTLPPVYDFANAAADAGRGARGGPAPSTAGPQETNEERNLRLVAQAIKERRPIGDTWLRHERRKELLDHTDVTEEDLAPYERKLVDDDPFFE